MQPITPIDPRTPLTVTLQAHEWNVVLGAMHKMPLAYEVSHPIIEQMKQQLIPPEIKPQAPSPGIDNGIAQNEAIIVP